VPIQLPLHRLSDKLEAAFISSDYGPMISVELPERYD
jgi:hypothetical protein